MGQQDAMWTGLEPRVLPLLGWPALPPTSQPFSLPPLGTGARLKDTSLGRTQQAETKRLVPGEERPQESYVPTPTVFGDPVERTKAKDLARFRHCPWEPLSTGGEANAGPALGG